VRKYANSLIVLLLIVNIGTAQDSVDVTFYYYPDNNPSSVHIPGEFNGWNPSSNISLMSYDALENSWSKTVRLRVGGPSPLPKPGISIPGAYQYKFHDGGWFSDPLNPRRNIPDEGNTYLFIHDPTIHLLLPNSTTASGPVRTGHPEITAYIFPSTKTEIDPNTLALSVGDTTFTNIGEAYDPVTNKFRFVIPVALSNGKHSLSISASTTGGNTNTDSSSFSIQADQVQFFTRPAQTWKLTWQIQGAIFTPAGEPDQSIKSAEIYRSDASWFISVNQGKVDTTISLLPGNNIFKIRTIQDDQVITSNTLTIQKKVRHEPRAWIEIIYEGDILIFSGGSSSDPNGGALSYKWVENPDNPAAIGLMGATQEQVNLSVPSVPGEYFVSLEVTDEEGERDSTTQYFMVDPAGSVDISEYADNAQWVKNSRIYLLFFKAFTPDGTIAAAIPKLRYISAMGFNTIWVLPVMEVKDNIDNQINIGYNIEDFMRVESSYGSAQDYKDFIAEAHELGLKVIQDVTPNHSGKSHVFAQEAKLWGDFSQYWHYYQNRQTEIIDDNSNGLGNCFTSEGIHYYCGFSDALLSWNWRDLDARNYMIEVYEHWMNEYGIDGYRFDVYWGPSRKFGEANMGIPVRKALRRIKPDIMLLGEDDGTGVGTEYVYADQGGGLDLAYDFKAYFNAIRSFGFSSSSINKLHSELDNGSYYPGENSYYLRFMESQDEDRISYKYNSFEKTKPMASVIFTAPGVPMILNGQEVGWGKGMGAPGEPHLNDRRRGIIDWDFEGKSMLTPHYQRLAQIRAQFPAFSQHKQDTNGDGQVNGSDESDFDRVDTGNSILYAFLRPNENSNGLTVVNFEATEQTGTLNLSSENLKFDSDFSLSASYWVNNHYAGTSEQVTGAILQNFPVTLPAYGTAIYTISEQLEMVLIPAIPGYVNISDNPKVLPEEIILHQCFPNPFNPITTISYNLPEQSHVKLTVLDVIGREVTTLQDVTKPSGTYEVQWNGLDQSGCPLSTGVYFARLQAGEYTKTIKMVFLR